MKLVSLITIFSALISLSAIAQSKTGKTEIDEEAFNKQLENCKIDTNVAPSTSAGKATAKPASSKVITQ